MLKNEARAARRAGFVRHITSPLADRSTIAWPSPQTDGPGGSRHVAGTAFVSDRGDGAEFTGRAGCGPSGTARAAGGRVAATGTVPVGQQVLPPGHRHQPRS